MYIYGFNVHVSNWRWDILNGSWFVSFQDAHGYELEIAEMKEKVNKYNQVVQVSLANAFKNVGYKKQTMLKCGKLT